MNRKQRRQAKRLAKQRNPNKPITEEMLKEIFEDVKERYPIKTYTTPGGVKMLLINGYWVQADAFDQAMKNE